MKEKHRMWQIPWGYKESIAVAGGIVGMGAMLQLTVGTFDFYLLATPFNLAVGAALVILSVTLGTAGRHSHFVKWVSGVPMSVSIITGLLFLTIIMGLIPQVASKPESRSVLGLDILTHSWPFILLYFTTLLSLGTLITRRLCNFRLRDYAFYLNHAGLWLLLASAGLGYADMERYVMYVQEGQTEWRVYDEAKNVKELPIAIQLNDFNMEVYPPKLAIIDRQTGEVQPLRKAQYFQIEGDSPHGELDGWDIEIKQYIHQAIRNSDSTYHEIHMPGAAPAASICVSGKGLQKEGWVCAGNQAQMYMTLPLNEQYSVVMTDADPRKFTSDIEVYAQDREIKQTMLEVNKPLRIGSWTIYQYGYDNKAGSLSSYSSFELVYDPWLTPVYAGIIIMMLGSATMIWTGRKRKEAQK